MFVRTNKDNSQNLGGCNFFWFKTAQKSIEHKHFFTVIDRLKQTTFYCKKKYSKRAYTNEIHLMNLVLEQYYR